LPATAPHGLTTPVVTPTPGVPTHPCGAHPSPACPRPPAAPTHPRPAHPPVWCPPTLVEVPSPREWFELRLHLGVLRGALAAHSGRARVPSGTPVQSQESPGQRRRTMGEDSTRPREPQRVPGASCAVADAGRTGGDRH